MSKHCLIDFFLHIACCSLRKAIETNGREDSHKLTKIASLAYLWAIEHDYIDNLMTISSNDFLIDEHILQSTSQRLVNMFSSKAIPSELDQSAKKAVAVRHQQPWTASVNGWDFSMASGAEASCAGSLVCSSKPVPKTYNANWDRIKWIWICKKAEINPDSSYLELFA